MVKAKLFKVQAKYGTLSTTTLVTKWFKKIVGNLFDIEHSYR